MCKGWDQPDPFIISFDVTADSIDEMGHVNNGVYIGWLQRVARAHASSVGLDFTLYRQLNRAMVVRRHEVDYLKPAFLADRLELGTWLVDCDRRLRVKRHYQLLRNGECLLRAKTDFVCVDLLSGRPRRLPEPFLARYAQILVETK